MDNDGDKVLKAAVPPTSDDVVRTWKAVPETWCLSPGSRSVSLHLRVWKGRGKWGKNKQTDSLRDRETRRENVHLEVSNAATPGPASHVHWQTVMCVIESL